jgi:hypothetical protein
MQILRLLLPVLWAVVSTVIGWFLYKWSTAKIESKGAAFTGAAVIAAAAFYGMFVATPRRLLADPELGAASRAAAELEHAAAQATKDCIVRPDKPRDGDARPDKLRCADTIQDLEGRSAQLHELLSRMTGD